MEQIINNIYDFNDINLQKIKLLINDNIITDIDALDKIIDPESINKNNDGKIIKELSVNSNEIKISEYKATNHLNKLLNTILPKVCSIPKNNEIQINHDNIDEFIDLIDQKISLITNIITN